MLLGHTGDTAETSAVVQGDNELQQKQKNRVRRVHSGDADEDEMLEEYDLVTGTWVSLDTAADPKYLDASVVSAKENESEVMNE